ncbi:MAG: ABC transporter permease [Candidatus Babeliales bacterium]
MKSSFKKIAYQEIPFFLATIPLAWQIMFGMIPFFIIMAIGRVGTQARFFWDNFLYFLFDPVHFKIICWSLWLAFAVSTVCLFISYPIAYWIARCAKKYRTFFLFLLVVPFWTNILVLAYSWILILEKTGLLNGFLLHIHAISHPFTFLNSFWAIFIVAVYCYMPFMILPLYSALEKIDTQLLEASADLGASWRQTFFNIILPLSWSGIRNGFLLVLVPVYGEFAIPALVGGDTYMLVGPTIAHYVFTALDLQKGAAFTLSACVVLLCVIGVIDILMRKLLSAKDYA